MEFFDRVILDNTIKMYTIVAGIILLALLVKRYLSRYIAALLYRFLHRIWDNVEKKHFVALVVKPLQLFILILVIVFSIDKLNFPSAWSYTLYSTNLQTLLERLGIGAIIFSFTWVTLRLIDFIAMVLEYKANLTDDQADNQLIVFFRDFFKVFLVFGGFLALLKFCFGQPIGPLVAGLGIAGAAIALAAKESLENIIASFIIFFDKPFITGDIIKVQNITGTVERIGLRSTRIRTAEKTLVSMPNKQMVDSVLDNHAMRTERRIEFKLLLDTATPVASIQRFIADARKLLEERGEPITNPSVFFTGLTAAGALVTVECFTPPIPMVAFNAYREELTVAIKGLLEREKITMSTAETKAGNE